MAQNHVTFIGRDGTVWHLHRGGKKQWWFSKQPTPPLARRLPTDRRILENSNPNLAPVLARK